MNRFEGKVALITGAGSGIGRATALRLASEGASVLGLDINAEGLAETASRAESGTIETLVCDISDAAACQGAVATAVERFGRLDVLGNIAGIARADHLGDVTEASYRQMMGVNVDGYFFMSQAAIPHLLHGGVVISIASNAGIIGQAYTVVYCMTKGAVIQMTRALAMEYMKTPLRVVAMAPGMVDTGLTHNYQMPKDVDWDLLGRYISPRGAASPETIAAQFAFLASDEASNIHGAIISTDHGMTSG
jgi:meso-butanediol dehydrogenase / (S,S)-butanediol dehydrogenase / diacetyl reductase